jgi:predicted amidophosphoribosyltransferase
MIEELKETWPPAPTAPKAAQSAEVPTCPSCGRKLLTVRSVLCNWCGAAINDADYLQRAAEERAAEDARIKEQLETELRESAKMGILGRLKKNKNKPTRSGADSLADFLKE